MGEHVVAAEFKQNIDELVILKKVLELHYISMPQRLMDQDFRLELLFGFAFGERFFVYHFGGIAFACFL